MTVRRAVTTARQLALSCHPAPTAAVTAFAVVLAVLAGNSVAGCAVLAAAVLCGQLSIGWSNDLLDARRDARAGRADKPVAMGRLPAHLIAWAIAAAGAATIGLSMALGWRAGVVHLGAVGCGWAYNLGVKATWASWLPYAVAFGALPAVATWAGPDHAGPPAWIVLASALLGVAANLTNALPDLTGDERTGVRGAPHRLGARWSLAVAAVLLLGVAVTVFLGPAGDPALGEWVGLLVGAAVVAVGLGPSLQRPAARATFYGLIVFVAWELAVVAATTSRLR